MNNKELMSYEAFNELINNLEYVEKITKYGRENIKYHVQRLQEENQCQKERIEYLERSITRKEDTIIDYQISESPILDKIIEYLKSEIKDSENLIERLEVTNSFRIERSKLKIKVCKELLKVLESESKK